MWGGKDSGHLPYLCGGGGASHPWLLGFTWRVNIPILGPSFRDHDRSGTQRSVLVFSGSGNRSVQLLLRTTVPCAGQHKAPGATAFSLARSLLPPGCLVRRQTALGGLLSWSAECPRGQLGVLIRTCGSPACADLLCRENSIKVPGRFLLFPMVQTLSGP